MGESGREKKKEVRLAGWVLRRKEWVQKREEEKGRKKERRKKKNRRIERIEGGRFLCGGTGRLQVQRGR